MDAETARQRAMLTHENRARAVELRRDGWSYREIARELDVSPATAYNYVADYLTELKSKNLETAEVIRNMEAVRLDKLLAGLWPKAETGDVPAVQTVLKIMERRARMYGLDLSDKVVAAAANPSAMDDKTFWDHAKAALAEHEKILEETESKKGDAN